jgi:hypothetical protein
VCAGWGPAEATEAIGQLALAGRLTRINKSAIAGYGCGRWGGWGYARDKATVSFCREHREDGELVPR